MPIPARFQLKDISPAELEEYTELCHKIEDGLLHGDDVSELLAKWHKRSARRFDPSEFTAYYKWTDVETFVSQAFAPAAVLVEDLTYAELYAVVETMRTELLPEAEQIHFLNWLKANLPDANVSDLLYWPNLWFNDQALLDIELTHDQFLRYAMLRSGRVLSDAPEEIELPVPLPEN